MKIKMLSLIAIMALPVVTGSLAAFNYKPLVTGCYFGASHNGAVSPVQSNFGSEIDVLYVIYKTHNNVLDVKEYRIKRYRGSAVLKNPFFKPQKGYRGIVPFHSDKKERPIIIQYFAEYIRKHFSALSENNHGDMMVQLFFYADADELTECNKSFMEHLKGYFKKPKPKKEHPLFAVLRDVQSAQIVTTADDASFNYANIFVAQNVTLEDLKTINEYIS